MIASLNEKLLYRAFYSFVDPWVRAFVLRKVLIEISRDNSSQLPSYPQSPNEGITFHFMHERMRQRVLSSIFQDDVS